MKYPDMTWGIMEAVVNKLGGMEGVEAFLQGKLEIKPVKPIIDLDADPFVPEDWKVEEHQKGGQFKWDAKQVELWLAEGQQNGKCLKGDNLREELKGKSVLNANVLDFLLKHPQLITEEWKGKCLFFWGTVYRGSDGRLFVRCLIWDRGMWDWYCNCLGSSWYGHDPAVLLAS